MLITACLYSVRVLVILLFQLLQPKSKHIQCYQLLNGDVEHSAILVRTKTFRTEFVQITNLMPIRKELCMLHMVSPSSFTSMAVFIQGVRGIEDLLGSMGRVGW